MGVIESYDPLWSSKAMSHRDPGRKKPNKIESVCNFQSVKIPVELNSLFSKFFCVSPGLLYHMIRRDTGRLVNEAFTSSLITSSKQ